MRVQVCKSATGLTFLYQVSSSWYEYKVDHCQQNVFVDRNYQYASLLTDSLVPSFLEQNMAALFEFILVTVITYQE